MSDAASAFEAGDPAVVGSWALDVAGEPHLRLRTGRIGLVRLDVTAPVVAGELEVAGDRVRLWLELSLARLRASRVLQGPARSLVRRYDGDQLTFDAVGDPGAPPWSVRGTAHSGHVDVPLEVTIVPAGLGAGDEEAGPRALDLTGAATLDEVHIPLPGLGRIRDFTFAVTGTVPVSRRAPSRP